MQANKLTLINFRNYSEQIVDFGDGVNIFYGDNAQGKTNILEAVYFFSMGKASRTHKDAEVIRHGEERADISLEFSDSKRESLAQISIFRDKRKVISVNEVPVRKNSELVGRFQLVYFGPEYLGLVKEGPARRRKNTDVLISQLRPAYFSALSDFKKISDSKNALLKMDRPNKAMLEIINEKMSSISANIILYRNQYISKIAEYAKEIQREISDGKEELEVKYLSCVGNTEGLTAEEIKAKLDKKLAEVWDREIESRESVTGPHREDIGYFINGKEAKIYASQGQQKTIVLAQKLAEVELMHQESGELPVVLLDDIMSELDRKRQRFILGHIQKTQLLITCTDTEGFELAENTRLFQVENGNVKEG